VSPQVRYQIKKSDGERVDNQGVIAVINGSVANILKGERLALNYLQRLSGVATTTHAFVQAVKPYGANILDTRKTTPLLRSLEKKAVLAGGGVNHRYGLYDQVLIKENHLQAVCEQEHMALDEAIPFAIKMSRQGVDDIVEIEVQTLDQAMSAVKAGADIVLLDNMSCADMARVVKDVRHRLKNKVLLEASGGISLDTVNTVAATGVDRISVGALTHSCEAVDYSLLFNV
jgi:nicotinate-nucleotide pyrophosphorylase (carboxylating)